MESGTLHTLSPPPLLQELGDKYSWTTRLHNGLAACQMRMGRWEEAESELLQVGGESGRWLLGLPLGLAAGALQAVLTRRVPSSSLPLPSFTHTPKTGV